MDTQMKIDSERVRALREGMLGAFTGLLFAVNGWWRGHASARWRR